MFRILSYPANIGAALLLGIVFSLMDLSYFYKSPDIFYIILLSTICLVYIFISFFFNRDVYVDNGNDGSSWKMFVLISVAGFAIEFSIGGMPILVGRENAVTLPVFHVIFYSFIIMAGSVGISIWKKEGYRTLSCICNSHVCFNAVATNDDSFFHYCGYCDSI